MARLGRAWEAGVTKVIPASFLKCMASKDRAQFGKGGMTSEEAIVAFAGREEKNLHKLIYADLTRQGIVLIHSRMDKRATTRKGLPDFCFVRRGTPIAIEVKTTTGNLRPEQLSTILQMERNGWECHVVRSFEEFKKI